MIQSGLVFQMLEQQKLAELVEVCQQKDDIINKLQAAMDATKEDATRDVNTFITHNQSEAASHISVVGSSNGWSFREPRWRPSGRSFCCFSRPAAVRGRQRKRMGAGNDSVTLRSRRRTRDRRGREVRGAAGNVDFLCSASL